MSSRRLIALLEEVAPAPTPERPGVHLRFRTRGGRSTGEVVDDFADLSPGPTVASALGLGRVLRLLRAARVAAPRPPAALLGAPAEAARRLERALGAAVVLAVRPRSSVHFTVWTEQGVARVDDVLEVVEDTTAFWVRRRDGALALRVPREGVVRRQTRCETWLEVTSIERA